MPRALTSFATAAWLALGASCMTSGGRVEPIPVQGARTPEDLSGLLESIAGRTDAEACLARARIYARLRELDGADAPILRTKGDAADIDVLSQAAGEDLKGESAGRLARHFLERAKSGGGTGSPFRGAPAKALHRFVLLTVAAYFGEYASREVHADALDGLSETAGELAGMEELRPEITKDWHLRAKTYALRADDLRGSEEQDAVTPEARKFCEIALGRHLDEATRAADRGTAEKAGRGDAGRALQSYLMALAHYTLARECLVSPTPAQGHALSGMEIVARSVCELIGREP